MSVSERHMRVSLRDLTRISPNVGFVMGLTYNCGANGGIAQLLNICSSKQDDGQKYLRPRLATAPLMNNTKTECEERAEQSKNLTSASMLPCVLLHNSGEADVLGFGQ